MRFIVVVLLFLSLSRMVPFLLILGRTKNFILTDHQPCPSCTGELRSVAGWWGSQTPPGLLQTPMEKEWENPPSRGCRSCTVRAGARHPLHPQLSDSLWLITRGKVQSHWGTAVSSFAGPHCSLLQCFWPFSFFFPEQQLLGLYPVWASGLLWAQPTACRGISLTCFCIWDSAAHTAVSRITFHQINK